MAERFELQDEAFRKVEPMKGAIDLVKGLVRRLRYPPLINSAHFVLSTRPAFQ